MTTANPQTGETSCCKAQASYIEQFLCCKACTTIVEWAVA